MNKTPPIKKNTICEITCRGLSSDGHGVGSTNGFTVFCPGLLPGEKARVLIIKVHSSYAVGKLSELLEASPDRTEPFCPDFARCGGCSLLHLSYKAQLAYKEQLVTDCLTRIGKISGFTADPILPCPAQKAFRNKAQYRFGIVNGRLCCGFYQEHSHRLIPTTVCMTEAEGNARIRRCVCELAGRPGLEPYDETAHTGLLRGLLIRTSSLTREAMAVLIINGSALPEEEAFVRGLTETCPDVTSVYLNENTRPGNTVLGGVFRKLSGKDFLRDAIGDVLFDISPGAFYQVNALQVQNLYDTVAEFSAAGPETSLLDLYCGVGTIGIYLAKKRGIRRLCGVECNSAAIEDARRNAVLNGLEGCLFKAGDTGRILEEDGPSFQPDTVVVDPPRKGCDEAALTRIAALGPERIVYVSCNPATLARDVKRLTELGYRCERVRPADMFPGTAHVETVVLMSRKDK